MNASQGRSSADGSYTLCNRLHGINRPTGSCFQSALPGKVLHDVCHDCKSALELRPPCGLPPRLARLSDAWRSCSVSADQCPPSGRGRAYVDDLCGTCACTSGKRRCSDLERPFDGRESATDQQSTGLGQHGGRSQCGNAGCGDHRQPGATVTRAGHSPGAGLDFSSLELISVILTRCLIRHFYGRRDTISLLECKDVAQDCITSLVQGGWPIDEIGDGSLLVVLPPDLASAFCDGKTGPDMAPPSTLMDTADLAQGSGLPSAPSVFRSCRLNTP